MTHLPSLASLRLTRTEYEVMHPYGTTQFIDMNVGKRERENDTLPGRPNPMATPGTIFTASAQLGAIFGDTIQNAACGPANICAALMACSMGASPLMESTFTQLLGNNTEWFKREGRFVGCYLKEETINGERIEFTQTFRDRANQLGFVLDTLVDAEQINSKVKSVTTGKIDEIINEDAIKDPDLLLVALAAEYIKVEWELKFNTRLTSNEVDFDMGSTGIVKCPMMYIKAQLTYQQILPLVGEPYELMFLKTKRGQDPSTVCGMVALPARGGSIKAMMDDIARRGKELERIVKHSRNYPPTRDAILEMPRLEKKMEPIEINETVKKFGLGDVFNDDAFDQMVQTQNGQEYSMSVGKILHATYLKWNEEGAEGAAVTAVEVYRSLADEDEDEEPHMRCDRPFVSYLIDVPNDNTPSSVLFSMVVSDGSCFDWTSPEPGSMAEAPKEEDFDWTNPEQPSLRSMV